MIVLENLAEKTQGHVLYHANCLDGLTAAWVVQKRFPALVPRAVEHGRPAPKGLRGNIFIVDFVYAPATLDHFARRAENIWVLDHHESALRLLDGYAHDKVRIDLDLTQSGAGLCWRTLFPESPVPKLVQYVEDRDLWSKKLPHCDAIYYWLIQSANKIEDLNEIHDQFEDPNLFSGIVSQAKMLENFVLSLTYKFVSQAEPVTLCGVPGLAVMSPILHSEIGHALLKHTSLGIVYTKKSEDWSISLRSRSAVNAALIAEQLGGGGHPQAAGFRCLELPWLTKV